jgi:CRISPR-associated endonuclease Cas1
MDAGAVLMVTQPSSRAARGLYEPARPRSSRRPGVCLVEGYGVSVAVRHGRLIVRDGLPGERRERVIGRVRPGFGRLVMLGHAGAVTLEALRWLADVGISFTQIDRDGRLIATSTPTPGDARLRRAQALAVATPAGLEVSRWLLEQKLAGQQQLLDELTDDPAIQTAFQTASETLSRATSVGEMVAAERDAAHVYWSAWAPLPVRLAAADARRLPEHWQRFGQRTSPFTGGPRFAATPGNALLNYAYAILEAETRIACLTVGLDPTLGVIHADYGTRDSLALDLMEPVRPHVDRHILDLVRTTTFRYADVFETRRGGCRILPPITRQLAQAAPWLAQLVAPIAEQAAHLFQQYAGNTVIQPTPLTQANRRADRARRYNRPPQPTVVTQPPKPERRCKRCGGPLPHRDRTYCDTCLPHFQHDHYQALAATAQIRAREQREQGADSSHGGAAGKRRSATQGRRQAELRDWNASNSDTESDPEWFRCEVVPRLHNVSLTTLARATGLTPGYLSQVRRGLKTPHPRHWANLAAATKHATGSPRVGSSYDL